MSSIPISIKHAGKTYTVPALDLTAPGAVFKAQIFELTGVDPSKVKVVVKGGMLKDDADMSKLGLKAGQTLMVIGAAGPLPEAPKEAVVFMEDMTDLQLAQAVAFPVGLENLGNTCYMNSTIQVLRQIPELQTALNEFHESTSTTQNDAALTGALRDLYKDMGKTSEGFPPLVFLRMLREFAPQFAERAPTGQFAQQDAQEAWTQIVTAMNNNLQVGASDSESGSGARGQFVRQYMTGEMTKTVKSVEAPDETATVSTENFSVMGCNISSSTNYMMTGITEALNEQLEKNSPSLGRSAVYQATSRISRLPAYLTVNLIRFYWRRDINKKTKIMRKVKFPFDLDLIDLVTDDLKKKLLPANEALKQIDKDRQERAKVRRRVKVAREDEVKEKRREENDRIQGIERDPELTSAAMAAAAAARATREAAGGSDAMVVDSTPAAVPAVVVSAKGKEVAAGELEDEPTKRAEEATLLRSVMHQDLVNDKGANITGLYELTAIVTHKGASADGGHYVGWSKVTNKTTTLDLEDPNKQDWYLFDDEKVSVVPQSKILTLDGGGEDHTAYILLYSAKKL